MTDAAPAAAAGPGPVISNNGVTGDTSASDENTALLDSKNAELHRGLAREHVQLTKKRAWGDDSDSDSNSDEEEDAGSRKQRKKQKKIVLGACVVGLCLFIAVVVAGSWLSANVANASGAQIAGYALLTVAGIITFFFVLSCCSICFSSCLGSLGAWQHDEFKEFNHSDIHQRRTRPVFIFKHWNDDFRMDAAQHEALLKLTARSLPKEARQELKKAQKARAEEEKKRKEELQKLVVDRVKSELQTSKGNPTDVIRKLRKRVYVVDFDASKNSDVERLAIQATLIVKVATPGNDVVVFRINSPGGFVSQYGLAASQIMRLRHAGFKTIACIDNIAASGGYMMACVCDEICAAPFAFVGSIGVITYVPNLERVTKESLKVDVYRFTAGKYKRTVDLFGEVTEEDKSKLTSELQLIHDEFKDHVKKHRGTKLKADIDQVATGEGWLATNALPYGLVDRLVTSDQVLMEFAKEYDVLVLTEFKKTKEGLLKELLSAEGSKRGLSLAALIPESFMRLMGVQPPAFPQSGPQLRADETAQLVSDMV